MKGKYHIITYLLLITIIFICQDAFSQRKEISLRHGWFFTHSDKNDNSYSEVDESTWETVSVPHDWAINGPFDKDIDKQ